jgi:hypothetical protein
MPKRTPNRAGNYCGSHGIDVAFGSLLAATILVVSDTAAAQPASSIEGVVADAATLELISSATITVVGQGLEVRSRFDGTFTFRSVPLGPASVQIEAAGYTTSLGEVEVSEGRVAFLQVLLSRAQGDASLQIRVIDGETGRPLANARVGFPELGLFTLATVDGLASITGIPSGQHILEVTMQGYAPAESVVEFDSGSRAEGEVRLGPQPIVLEGVTVSTRARFSPALARSGFYDRARRGIGRQLDRIEIEAKAPIFPSDVFRGMPGVRLVPIGFGRYALMGTRGASLSSAGRCPMQLYLDGRPWQGNIDDLEIDHIEAIEVYAGVSQIPVQYSTTAANTTCGVVLIWRR